MMIMLLNQKYEIFPTEDQKETLDCWLQYCRQTYNSALLDKQRKYKQSKMLYNRFDMQRQLKLDKEKHVFLKEMPSQPLQEVLDRKSTRLNSSHVAISYVVVCWH